MLASAKVEDFHAEPSSVILGASGGSALGTPDSRLRDNRTEDEVATFNGGEVDSQAGGQYTADCGVRFTGRSRN